MVTVLANEGHVQRGWVDVAYPIYYWAIVDDVRQRELTSASARSYLLLAKALATAQRSADMGHAPRPVLGRPRTTRRRRGLPAGRGCPPDKARHGHQALLSLDGREWPGELFGWAANRNGADDGWRGLVAVPESSRPAAGPSSLVGCKSSTSGGVWSRNPATGSPVGDREA
jgi:hypothetical protein